MTVLRYWGRVIRRAFFDTRTALGHSWKKSLGGCCSTMIMFGMLGFAGQAAQVWTKAVTWIFAVASSVVFFLAVFLYHLFVTPAKIEEETKRNAEEEKVKLKVAAEQREAELNTKLQQVENGLQQLQQDLAKQRDLAAKGETLADKAIRHHVEDFIKRFEEIKSRAAAEMIPAGQLCGVEAEARHYLEEHLPAYRDFCAGMLAVAEWNGNQPFSPAQAIERCEARLQELRQILHLLS